MGIIVVACPPHSIVGIVGYSSIQPLFFFVRAEVFHGVIVASPSCTAYHWGSLIALYETAVMIMSLQNPICRQ